MFQSSNPNPIDRYAVEVPLGDRWRIYYRLQELTIPCVCPRDGSLLVEINHGIAAILLRSTVQQFTASREELIHWLERCWDTETWLGGQLQSTVPLTKY